SKLPDSNLKMRMIADCPRVLCASPKYLERRGAPTKGAQLVSDKHDCLLLRFPGTAEFRWTLVTGNTEQEFDIKGPFETDDGDVLTQWALDGLGIINIPFFEAAEHLKKGALVEVCQETPPTSVQLTCLYPHRKFQDPKIRLFIDYMVDKCRRELIMRQAV
ncbi:MAG: substrate binding domain-containing protein, partial [Pseudomonadota bacterium]